MTDRTQVVGTVTALLRPPVRQSTLVRSDIRHTFEVFVREIGTWWPVRPFSVGTDRVHRVTLEQRRGGRVFETWDDGSTRDWGTLLKWTPPSGFIMTWHLTGAPTEVELSFAALGPQLTRVAVEHRGWEALSEADLAKACALPGGYLGGSFNVGWAHILTCLGCAVDAASSAEPSLTRHS